MKPALLIQDRDTRFGQDFRDRLSERGCHSVRLPICTPQLNIYAERWIKSCRRECLDHFVAFGERHLGYLLRQYVAYYHRERPHQGLGNTLLPVNPRKPNVRSGEHAPRDGPDAEHVFRIVCKQRLVVCSSTTSERRHNAVRMLRIVEDGVFAQHGEGARSPGRASGRGHNPPPRAARRRHQALHHDRGVM